MDRLDQKKDLAPKYEFFSTSWNQITQDLVKDYILQVKSPSYVLKEKMTFV
jgi:hypothetical protein